MAPPPPFQFVDEDDQLKTDHTSTNHGTFSLYGKILLVAVASIALVVFIVILVRIYERRILHRREARVRTQEPSHAGSVRSPVRGLDPLLVAKFPTFAYKQTNSLSMECAVCLSLLEDQEMARVLPNCRHAFHADCIDKWLGSRSTCPVCRTEADPRLPRPVPRDRPNRSSTGRVQADVQDVVFENLERQTVPAGVSDIYALYG